MFLLWVDPFLANKNVSFNLKKSCESIKSFSITVNIHLSTSTFTSSNKQIVPEALHCARQHEGMRGEASRKSTQPRFPRLTTLPDSAITVAIAHVKYLTEEPGLLGSDLAGKSGREYLWGPDKLSKEGQVWTEGKNRLAMAGGERTWLGQHHVRRNLAREEAGEAGPDHTGRVEEFRLCPKSWRSFWTDGWQ